MVERARYMLFLMLAPALSNVEQTYAHGQTLLDQTRIACALARTQADLITSSDELRRSNQYKSEFLANMSHELRTPLNSSLILAGILADNKDGNLTPGLATKWETPDQTT